MSHSERSDESSFSLTVILETLTFFLKWSCFSAIASGIPKTDFQGLSGFVFVLVVSGKVVVEIFRSVLRH